MVTNREGGLARLSNELPSVERLYSKYLLAAAYNKLQLSQEGLAVTAELLKLVNETGKRSIEGELHRLTGELLLQEGGKKEAEAEQSYRDAIAMARGQCARACELR